MVSNPLLTEAVRSIWHGVDQDLQYIIQPARLTGYTGARGYAQHLLGTIQLPNSRERFHFFQIGNINATLLGLVTEVGVWIPVVRLMNEGDAIINVYSSKGIHYPRSEVYFQKTPSGNLVMAIVDQLSVGAIREEAPFIRLYSNAFFASDRARESANSIICRSIRVIDQASALSFLQDYRNKRAGAGDTQLYHNGRYIGNYIPSSVTPGDSLEYVYDSSVKQVVDLTLGELSFFVSRLDNRNKYLFHHEGEQVGPYPMIDYFDDIDFYIVNKVSPPGNREWDGVYFHRNKPDAVRQVTHRDYSLTVDYVQAMVAANPQWTDVSSLTVRAIIREAGFERKLQFDKNRIVDLYRLPPAEVTHVMTGREGPVPEWYSANLEEAAYPLLMRSTCLDLTPELVVDAMGYHGVTKLIADTPKKVVVRAGSRTVKLPPQYQEHSTAYEYNADGKLLGYHYHLSGRDYAPYHAETHTVEMISGRGEHALDAFFGRQVVEVDARHTFRAYVGSIQQGRLNPETWRDVTGNDDYYHMVGNNVVWGVDGRINATCVKLDRTFLAYDLELDYRNGLLRFSIDGDAEYPADTTHGVLYIPPGKLELWLNGRALIEDLDYYVKWPQVVIVNKKYRNPGTLQLVTVRGTGFCDRQMQREPASEFNFVRHGLLSRDDVHHVRDDKVQSIVVDGRLLDRDELAFDENGFGQITQRVANGSPYRVDTMHIPLRFIGSRDPYEIRDGALELDRRVEAYLSGFLTSDEAEGMDTITDRYPVFSPLCSTLIYDLINGIFPMEPFIGQYSDRTVREAMRGYEYLLDYDPCLKTKHRQHVDIHPHDSQFELQLDIYQYNLVERVVRLYLNDEVDLTHFVSIKPGWF